MLIDCSVEIAPFAADPNVSLVNPNRSAIRSAKLAKTLLGHRRIAQYPAVYRAMINLEAALFEHFFQASIAQRISHRGRNKVCSHRHAKTARSMNVHHGLAENFHLHRFDGVVLTVNRS